MNANVNIVAETMKYVYFHLEKTEVAQKPIDFIIHSLIDKKIELSNYFIDKIV